jgi:hypothetical protein
VNQLEFSWPEPLSFLPVGTFLCCHINEDALGRYVIFEYDSQSQINSLIETGEPFWLRWKNENDRTESLFVKREGDLAYGIFQAHDIVICRLREVLR